VLFEFHTQGERIPVEARRRDGDWLLVVDGREVPLQAVPGRDGEWRVSTHQGTRRLWVAARGDERFVFCGGRVHVFRLADRDGDDDAGHRTAGPGLVASMPGRVVRLLVGEGDAVAAGQGVLILESMKMETELAAGVAGTVARIHVAAGQQVGQGDPLVDIRPEAGA
jgi:acetyl/propionyl-CoA carboxylase alpha subunit